MLERYPKDVKVVHKNFPLSRHRYAMKAATAALAANGQGKFWEFHHRLLDSYRNLNDAKIREIAKGLGLDMVRLEKDMKDPAIQELIIRDVMDGRQAGVRSIPTVFINGKRLKKRNLQNFQQMIEGELKKKR